MTRGPLLAAGSGEAPHRRRRLVVAERVVQRVLRCRAVCWHQGRHWIAFVPAPSPVMKLQSSAASVDIHGKLFWSLGAQHGGCQPPCCTAARACRSA